ncbi:hypothetical protein [Iningainema tapete]|nr:hypothetical protein [Iningainema tapete]
MQLILSSLKQVFCQTIFIVCLMVFMSLSTVFSFQQPSFAVTSATNQLTPQEKIDRAYEYNQAAGFREEQRQKAYEQAIKDSETPQTLEKAYERNVKASKLENQEPNIIEKAQELIEDVTGK